MFPSPIAEPAMAIMTVALLPKFSRELITRNLR